MKKIIKLNERDLTRIIKRVIKEQSGPTMKELKEMEAKVYVLMVPFYDEYGMENTVQLLMDVASMFAQESGEDEYHPLYSKRDEDNFDMNDMFNQDDEDEEEEY
jgi:hypothetical protein